MIKPHPIFCFLLFAFCLLPFSIFAQPNLATTPYIEVTGKSRIEVTPDLFDMQIVLKEYLDGKFKVTVAEQEAKMKNMFKIAGINLSTLKQADIDADNITITKREREVIAEKTFHITISSIPLLTSAFQVLNDLKIHNTKIISVYHSQMDSLQHLARVNAIEDAREKAKSLLSATDNKTGKLLFIKENDCFVVEGSEEDEYVFELKKMIICCTFFVRFAME